MFLSNVSIRRPVAMVCLIIALTGLGINAYRKLGLELMPKVDMPFITVVTVYPGASPDELETDVAKRIEDAVVTIDGLKHVSSVCMENVCQTLLEFHLNVDVDIAATDVREKIDLIQNDLPADVEKPKILKFDINAQPIINLALTGDVPLDELYDYADNTLRDRISVLPGVAEVQLIGGQEREVQVLLDREKLGQRGLTAHDVVLAIQNNVRTIPSGHVKESGTEYTVKFDADYATVSDLGTLEIANRNGARCYLHDVSELRMASAESRQAAFLDGKPCVAIRVVKKADANAVQVVNNVRAALDSLRKSLPGGMDLTWVSDAGAFIQSTVDSATSNIFQGVLLTGAILFFFLYNFRSTLIVAVTMPLSVVISLFFIYLLGYTLNTPVLTSLALSVGILVTNSIVVLESIVRKVSEGVEPREAARTGTGEVAVAVLASAGTNIVVLFPVAMMGSLVGFFFRPFAITMVIVTAVSLFISFTLTPIMSAVLLKRGTSKGMLAKVEAAFNQALQKVAGGYGLVLHTVAKHRTIGAAVLVVTVVLLIHALSLVPRIGFGFFRDPDRGEIFVRLEYPTYYSLERTIDRVHEAENALRDMQGLEHMFTTIGKVEGIIGQSSEGVYLAQILLKFVQKTERSDTMDDLLAKVNERLKGYTDSIVTANVSKVVGGQGYAVELEIAGDEIKELEQLALKIADYARNIPGFLAPDTSVRAGKPELRVKPKREVLSDLNAPALGLGMTLRANLEGLKAGVFKQSGRTYDIRVKLAEEFGKDQVADFLLPGSPDSPVNLTALANVHETTAPIQITRNDKRRITKVYANLASTKPLGNAVKELSGLIDQKAQLPPGYSYRFAGQYEIMQEAIGEFLEAGILAIALTYLTLAAILESFTQPFLILVTVPLGLIGVLWSLYLAGESISMFVLLGAVMLVGIVVNNAILIMDEVNQQIRAGVSRHRAMEHAAIDQFRPILMITLAAILGMLPLAFGRGLGSEMRTSVGVASVGGILVSAVLTLVVFPILYEMFTRNSDNHKG
ncbi:MAG TPA: efflux RND transporter permease subunit [Candidatus Hydrogenedentes bacterium]|nr:efflux RND transporter permease subunit [Candidatus Hydrogenedentota bacterium]HOL75417.1 efflux RND transporter permease subunit [Candidatus Hydrogenedentota bacterium]HPO84926.1 efflux RND transporter permease subunit [Candidatus Hydrogenedentota bacterium]